MLSDSRLSNNSLIKSTNKRQHKKIPGSILKLTIDNSDLIDKDDSSEYKTIEDDMRYFTEKELR